MYKVMIVDDEMLVRIGIRSLLDWKEMGFEIVAEAGNGELAYEKYLALKPEVVITDIKMPKKDGMWLTDRIKENDAEAEIVFLTCYDDFEYARKALQKKVSSYVLKAEMEEEELRQIMTDVKKRLDSRAYMMGERNKEEKPGLRSGEEHLLAYVLDTRKTLTEVQEEFETYQIVWKEKKFVFLQFDFNASLKEELHDKEKIAHIISACKELILNKWNNKESRCFSKQFGKSITCLLIADELTEFHLKKDLDYIKESIWQYFNISLKSLSSEITDSMEHMRSEVEWIFNASDALFYVPKGEHRQKGQLLCNHQEHMKLNVEDYIREFSQGLEENNKERYMEVCEKFRTEISNLEMNSFQVKFDTARIITNIMNRFEYCMENQKQKMTYQKDIMDVEDMNEMISMLQQFGEAMLKLIANMKMDNADILIEKAITYIQNNYTNKITLDDVAKYIGISKYYLSFLFKKEKDINFTTFINKLRIEKAKELLMQPQMTINQVYSETGFNDQQYFSKTFKKYVGMTVTEFRTR